MQILKRLLTRDAPSGSVNDTYWDRIPGPTGISPGNAEGLAAVYACVSAISETVASLPLQVYERGDSGREVAREHPLYRLVHEQPNDWQTALEFRELLQRQVLLRGNGFAEIKWAGDGTPEALIPLHPDRVTILDTPNGYQYEHQLKDGGKRRLLPDEVLHLKYHSDDGVLGRSPVEVARETVELGLAERQHGVSSFRNGTRVGGVLKVDKKLNDEQRKTLRDSWLSSFAGAFNSGKTPVLEGGMDYQPVSMSLEDADWIAARQMSVEEVCRLFRVPPTMVGDLRHGNYSNTVELTRQFVTHTLRRHLVEWEQALRRSSLVLGDYYAEHNVEGLLRGDSTTRAAFYQRGIEDGWLLRSEVRAMENLSPVEGIDEVEGPSVA